MQFFKTPRIGALLFVATGVLQLPLFSATAQVSLPTQSASAGSNIVFPVTFQAGSVSIAGLQFDVQYDNTVMTVTASLGAAASSAGKSLYTADVTANTKRVVITGMNVTAISSGTVVNLSVTLNANDVTGVSQLNFANVVATDPNGMPTSITSSNGAVTIVGATQYLLTTSASPSGKGSVTASPASATGYYNAGTAVQLTATAATGCTFSSWSGTATGVTNPMTITLSAAQTVTANFQCGGSGSGFVTSWGLSGPALRNDYTGYVGMALTVGSSPLTVSSLGRICVAGNATTHVVKIVNAGSGGDVAGASVALNMAGCTGGQFVYGTVNPVVLPAGGSYYVVSQETYLGDLWYDDGTISTTAAAAVNSGVYFGGGSWVPYGPANSSFVPVNFQYSVASPAPVFVTSYGLNNPALRNDYSGWVGMALTVGSSPLTVSSLGRICAAGNSTTHVVKLVNGVTGGDVAGASVALNMAGCTAGQFVYGTLNPVVLAAGGSYYVVSQEAYHGDLWYDDGTITTSTAAAVNSGVYYASTGSWVPYGPANSTYVPVNFQYSIGSPSSGFVTSYNLNNPVLRHDYTGWVGMALTVGSSPLSVSSLGRICVAGNSTTHVVKLVNGSTGSDVAGASASLNMAGCTAGQFVYGTVNPVTLAAGGRYYVVSQETYLGDLWYDNGTITTSTAAAVNSAVYYASTGSWVPYGPANSTYVPVNFQYSIGSPSSGFLTSYNLNNPVLRHDYTGWVGMSLTVGSSPLSVSSLGRICVAGNSTTHVVKLVNGSTGSDIAGASASLNMAGCTAGQFVYGTVNPVALAAGGSYYVVSQETYLGDLWYDNGTISTTAAAAVNSGVYYASGGIWVPYGPANSTYVPVDFQYSQ
jgi:hypothetical protein